jgi:hypothetical protein
MNWMTESQDSTELPEHENRGEENYDRGRSSWSLPDKAAVLAALHVQRGQVVLDAGCGNGHTSKRDRLFSPDVQ